jgi:IS30 family transposase
MNYIPLEDIASQAGLSVSTIRREIRLGRLGRSDYSRSKSQSDVYWWLYGRSQRLTCRSIEEKVWLAVGLAGDEVESELTTSQTPLTL